MRSYFQYITSILVNVQCIKWKRTRITCGVISTIWQQAHSYFIFFKSGVGGGILWVGACLWGGGGWLERGVWCDTVCLEGVDGGWGVTLCVSGWRGVWCDTVSGVDGCVCGVTLCVQRGTDGCCVTVSGGSWMGLWCDA